MGMDKVLLFVKSIDRKERESIGVQLEDDNGGNALVEDWAKGERVCRLHDEGRAGILLAATQPTRDGQSRGKCNNALLRKGEISKRKGLTEADMEALIRDAYKSLKLQVEAEGKLPTELKPRQMVDEDKVASRRLRANDVADTKAKVRYNGTTGEGLKQAIFSSCEGTTTKDSRATNASMKVDECFKTHNVFQTSSDEGASLT